MKEWTVMENGIAQEPPNQESAPTCVTPDDGVVAELGALPPGAILTRMALARIFKREPISISRAVERGELPRPAYLLGNERWTAGAIIRHFEKRMVEAAEDARVISRHSI